MRAVTDGDRLYLAHNDNQRQLSDYKNKIDALPPSNFVMSLGDPCRRGSDLPSSIYL